MSEIDNNPAAAENNNPVQTPVEQESSYSMFNDPISVDYFDDDDIAVNDNFFSSYAEVETQDPERKDGAEAPATENNNNKGLVFDDPIIEEDKASEENKSDDELKAILEKRGFNVSKPTEQDVNVQREQEIQRLSNVVTDAKNFLNLPDSTIVREKVKAELSRQYVASGRQGLIGTEEFEIELDAEYEMYSENKALLSVYASNIKTEVQNVISDHESQLNSKKSEVEAETKKAVIEKRGGLQNSVNAIHQNGAFGIKPTPEESKEIYNSIISGEFTKTVNSDPNLVAEFATFIKFREQINSKLGSPTYGEGVKDAAESINGGPLKTESSLATVVKNTAHGVTGGGANNNRKKAWAQEHHSLDVPTDQNNMKVAGTGVGFL